MRCFVTKRKSVAIFASFLLALGAAKPSAAQNEIRVDLTNYVNRTGPDPLGPFSVTVVPETRSSHDSRPLTASPTQEKLPLNLLLESTEVSGSQRPLNLQLHLRIRNSGSKSFLLPVAFDAGRKSVLAGNTGRRTLTFAVKFRLAGGEERTLSTVVTEGSETAKGSLVEVGPGESALILFQVNLLNLNDFIKKGQKVADIQAGIQQAYIEDSKYSIVRVSEYSWSEYLKNQAIDK